MDDHCVDFCIVGQGLAGTSLAWTLHRRGCKLAIIDQRNDQSSSRVAAGLITPITGQRFVKSKQFDQQLKSAIDFYREIEQVTGQNFLSINEAIRLFSNAEEKQNFLDTRKDEFSTIAKISDEPLDRDSFSPKFGGFEMKDAGRLDVPGYLDASHGFLSNAHQFVNAGLTLPDDLIFTEDAIEIPKFDLSAKRILFCEGFSGANNPWFQTVPFDSAKGEILTVKIDGLTEKRVVHCGIWMVRIDEGTYRVGATYDRVNMNSKPTKEGRVELVRKLSNVIKLPFEVLDHSAGVRPVIVGRRPMVGFHPEEKRLGYFNGLGSKGSLQAPWFSKMFGDHIVDGTTIPQEYDVSRYFEKVD